MKRKTTGRMVAVAAMTLLAGMFSGTAQGESSVPTSFYWTNAVSGAWGVAGSWTNDLGWVAAPTNDGQANYTLSFNQAGTTVTASNNLGSGFLLNQLNFGGPAVTLAGNSLALTNNGATLPQVSQNSATPIWIGNDITLGADTTFGGTGGGAVTVTGAISGPGGLTKSGSSTLTIGGTTKTYGGATVINGGVLTLNTSIPAILTNAVLRIDATALASGDYSSVANLGTRGGSFSTSSGSVPVGNGNAFINGRNAFLFDGANALTSATAYANSGSNMTIFTVASTKATGVNASYKGYLSLVRTNTVADYNDSSNSVAALTANNTGNKFGQYRSNAGIAGLNTDMPQGYSNPFITVQTFNGATSTFTLTGTNGVTTTAANVASTGNFNINNTAIGGRYGGSLGSYWYGDVGEVLIFNTTLSAADITAVRDYLAYKWFGIGSPATGLPANLPHNTAASIASGASFDLGGATQTVASLSDSGGGGGSVTNRTGTAAMLTINPSSGSATFSGAILGAVGVVKDGVGTQVLAGASAYAGGTTVSNGTLRVNGSITGAVSVITGSRPSAAPARSPGTSRTTRAPSRSLPTTRR
jgi:fibronectin-binding autotransporter adhesin